MFVHGAAGGPNEVINFLTINHLKTRCMNADFLFSAVHLERESIITPGIYAEETLFSSIPGSRCPLEVVRGLMVSFDVGGEGGGRI